MTGRPRIIAPPDEELTILGEELLLWANKPDSLFMAQFYACEKHILRKDWKNIIQRMPFVPYYEEAQIIIGTRHLTGALKEGIAHRFIRLYHHDVREDDDEIRRKDNEKSQGPQNVTYNINYDPNDTKQVLPQILPTPDTESSR